MPDGISPRPASDTQQLLKLMSMRSEIVEMRLAAVPSTQRQEIEELPPSAPSILDQLVQARVSTLEPEDWVAEQEPSIFEAEDQAVMLEPAEDLLEMNAAEAGQPFAVQPLDAASFNPFPEVEQMVARDQMLAQPLQSVTFDLSVELVADEPAAREPALADSGSDLGMNERAMLDESPQDAYRSCSLAPEFRAELHEERRDDLGAVSDAEREPELRADLGADLGAELEPDELDSELQPARQANLLDSELQPGIGPEELEAELPAATELGAGEGPGEDFQALLSGARQLDPAPSAVREASPDDEDLPLLPVDGEVKLRARNGPKPGAEFVGKGTLAGATGLYCLIERFNLPAGTRMKLTLNARGMTDRFDIQDAVVKRVRRAPGNSTEVQLAFEQRHEDFEEFVAHHFGDKPVGFALFSRRRPKR